MDRFYVNQKTIALAFDFSGVGVHSGKEVKVSVKPAGVGEGIKFIRKDIDSDNVVIVNPDSISQGALGSCITNGKVSIKTLEHFMAAIYALGITSLVVEMSGEEMPILTGNSVEYLKLLQKACIQDLGEKIEGISLNEPVWMEENGCMLLYFPHDSFKISYYVDYNDPVIGKQQYIYEHSKDNFIDQISKARTFCFYRDVEIMRERGLGLGGSLDNALVAYEDRYSSELFYENEPVRHKTLDLVGDLFLTGLPIRGHIIAVKSNHAFNGRFAKKIYEKQLEQGVNGK